ncbi:hypothetical protein CRV03_03530 [Arcobacter sp. F155]|uniref:hypothetical protein n=1 Tax=Arcobacter sp. F155 TaxID=2044512 RepID=UPI00100AF357|nr:hypothetical protein [Arcobacter sp. F155]RXJ78053.1 hypothetical protein CRV03_03530 [Arcobacter sp. F155]
MVKINYPEDTIRLKSFEDEYKKIINDFLQEKKIDVDADLTSFLGKCYDDGIKFEDTITMPFEELFAIAENFKRKFLEKDDGKKRYKFKFKVSGEQKDNAKKLKKLFPYDDLQPEIASFFRKYYKELNIRTCMYCNLDNINPYSTFSGNYSDLIDFMNNASKKELKDVFSRFNSSKINLIHNTIYQDENEIITQKNNGMTQCKVDKLKKSQKFKEDNYDHFTLDHFLDKGTLPLLSLCLYNFVPSCYTCNSKLKKQRNLVVDKFVDVSPTHKEYDFDLNVKFELFYNLSEVNKETNFRLININNEDNFELDLNDTSKDKTYEKFIQDFKLKARYKYHKDKALKLIEKKKKYSDSNLKSISKLIYNSESYFENIKKDIFGEEIFDENIGKVSLSKLKKDIAKNIGIK